MLWHAILPNVNSFSHWGHMHQFQWTLDSDRNRSLHIPATWPQELSGPKLLVYEALSYSPEPLSPYPSHIAARTQWPSAQRLRLPAAPTNSQHTSAIVSNSLALSATSPPPSCASNKQSACVNTRPHTPAYVSIRQHTLKAPRRRHPPIIKTKIHVTL